MHAYSLLEVRTNIRGSGISLLVMRNPHGTGGEAPDLPWKDNDVMWEEHPMVAEACGVREGSFASDGLFFLSKEDFFKYFNTVYLLKCAMDMKDRTERRQHWSSHYVVGESCVRTCTCAPS